MIDEKKYLVLKYPLDDYTLDEVRSIYDSIVKQMKELDPTCRVIAIPMDWEWLSLTPEQLQQMSNAFKWIMEHNEDDINSETRAGAKNCG